MGEYNKVVYNYKFEDICGVAVMYKHNVIIAINEEIGDKNTIVKKLFNMVLDNPNKIAVV